MYIIKNSFKNIKRNIGRNTLVAVMLLAIISSVAVSIIIYNASSAVIDNYKSKYGSRVYININMEKYKENKEIPPINNNIYLQLSKSDKIHNYYFSTSLYSKSKNVVPVEEKNNKDNMVFSNTISGNGMTSSDNDMEKVFTIKGSSNINEEESFKNKKRKLVDGRIYENDNECIISKKLAEKNNLKLGEEIEFTGIDYDNTGNMKEKGNIKLKIVGIYEDEPNNINNNTFSLLTNENNDIFTNINTLISNTTIGDINLESVFYLKSPELLEGFKSEAKALGLPEIYEVTTDEASYKRVIAPIQSLSNISIIFTIIILLLGIIILILLSLISNRERKYEIGVLRAMGMSKTKLVLNFIYESLIIVVICLVIGITIGSLVANPVANGIIKNQIENSQNTSGEMIIFSISGQGEEPLEEIDVSLDIKSVIEIVSVSILLLVIANIISIVYITKFEPINILSERS